MHMRWHAEHRTKDGEMVHPSDAEAWLTFNDIHPDFAMKTRNVWLGLCTNGFNPFGSFGSTVFIVACNCHTIQSYAMDVHEEAVYVFDRDFLLLHG